MGEPGIKVKNPRGGDYVYEEELLLQKFPDDFVWGVGTSAFQIEGGLNSGGRGPSIWDSFATDDGSDASVACDSYRKYAEDVRMIKEMGLKHYRFSISWSRILPEGVGRLNAEGVLYYNKLIDELLSQGITPVPTLYHFDLPQSLEDKGGWRNAEIAAWFEEYAVTCFKAFGDRVKMWITLNEPFVQSLGGYEFGFLAPGVKDPGHSIYITGHNQIRAHAKAYRAYKRHFAKEQKGRVGITLYAKWFEPEDASLVEASRRRIQFEVGFFAHPIFVDGNYPAIMRERVDANSLRQGFPNSRLPTFTAEESAEIAGSSDFFGLNHYTSDLIAAAGTDEKREEVSFFNDCGGERTYQPDWWFGSGSSWLKVAPFGLRRVLNWIKEEYGGKTEIYMFENGVSDTVGNIDDMHRIYYFKHYINQVLKAVRVDGVNVKGYFAWSLMDNFEWNKGYSEKFGIFSVDFTDPDRPRKAKASAKFLTKIARDNGFVGDNQ